MNENLENQIATILKKSLEVAEKTGNFVLDQAPELLRQFYTWHLILNFSLLLVGFFLIIGVFKISNLFGSKEKPKNTDKKYKYFWGRYFILDSWNDSNLCNFLMTRILGSIIPLIFIIGGLHDVLKIIITPKLYLIEYFLN